MSPSGSEYINAAIRALPGAPVHRVDASLHRLQWNENPFDYPDDLKEEVLQRLARVPWSRYPLGVRAYDLMDALGRFYSLPAEATVVGNGSSDLLRIVISAALAAGDHMVTIAPTFQAYRRHAQLVGATAHEVALDPDHDFALPVDRLIAHAAEHRAKLVVVCAPNNPTGTVFDLHALDRIAAECDALVMIDAAYGEFCRQDVRPLLAAHDNVITVHTFSKAFGLAGARIGYALAAPPVATELQKLVTAFTLSPFSEAAAIVALNHVDRFAPRIDHLVAAREKLAADLAALPGIRVYPSGTNFLCIRLACPAKAAQSHLLQTQRLLVSEISGYPGFENYLRISVGAPDQNALVVAALTEFCAQRVT
jgi:histidinol-phosphate aminotransferase